MGAEVGAYPQPPLYKPGDFLYCLWSKKPYPELPGRTYSRRIPLTNLDDIYKFNQEKITYPATSIWLSVKNRIPYLVIETD